MKHPDKLSRKEAADALGVTTKTLALWERQGKIPAPERDWRGWRMYEREAIHDMRRKLIGGDERAQPSLAIPALEVSARNRFTGVITELNCDGVMCEVVIELADGTEITSVVTRGSIRRLGLRVGDRVTALVKATDVMLAR